MLSIALSGQHRIDEFAGELFVVARFGATLANAAARRQHEKSGNAVKRTCIECGCNWMPRTLQRGRVPRMVAGARRLDLSRPGASSASSR
ncbi:hypothetical protein [Tahibacter aquaticus]|uniref:hypothetical protein n=1 Tax=Tahibacter aquaticus TaxID=520092 RepID=UPI0010609FB8|nr:hypothetical protein [Tahibacter aquaticus]